jgi:hypothetical protein
MDHIQLLDPLVDRSEVPEPGHVVRKGGINCGGEATPPHDPAQLGQKAGIEGQGYFFFSH